MKTKKTFTTGTYSTRSICDNDCIFTVKVIKRTAKTATIETRMNGVARVKIHTDESGNEFFFPFGQYSMAPTIKA
jgi:hypothetical protein